MGTDGDVLHGFTIERVLSSDERTKCITVLGRNVLTLSWPRAPLTVSCIGYMKGCCTYRYENKRGTAVVTLRRRHFDECSLPRLLSRETHAALHFENDIYTKASHPLMICCVNGSYCQGRKAYNTLKIDYKSLVLQYTGKVPAELGEIDIDRIYPATDKHISKHEEQAYFMASLVVC
jgi:hypothetical protein